MKYIINVKSFDDHLGKISKLSINEEVSLIQKGAFDDDPTVNEMIYGYLAMSKLNSEIAKECTGTEEATANMLLEDFKKGNLNKLLNEGIK